MDIFGKKGERFEEELQNLTEGRSLGRERGRKSFMREILIRKLFKETEGSVYSTRTHVHKSILADHHQVPEIRKFNGSKKYARSGFRPQVAGDSPTGMAKGISRTAYMYTCISCIASIHCVHTIHLYCTVA